MSHGSDSGHVAGIVNPPASAKYNWLNDYLRLNSHEWLMKATEYKGSW
ncbi:hypothetical protein ACE5D9_04770 [Rickettsia sp. 2024-CO-Wats]